MCLLEGSCKGDLGAVAHLCRAGKLLAYQCNTCACTYASDLNCFRSTCRYGATSERGLRVGLPAKGYGEAVGRRSGGTCIGQLNVWGSSACDCVARRSREDRIGYCSCQLDGLRLSLRRARERAEEAEYEARDRFQRRPGRVARLRPEAQLLDRVLPCGGQGGGEGVLDGARLRHRLGLPASRTPRRGLCARVFEGGALP